MIFGLRLALRSLGEVGPYRLSVRTQAFQAWKPGSTPGRVIKRRKQTNCFVCGRFMKPQPYPASLRESEAGSASTYIFCEELKQNI